MQELKEECIQKSENHHIKQYLINSKRLEVITIENTKLYFYRTIPYEHYLVDNGQQQLNPKEAAMFILHTHLKHFTTNGLNPDEFILILDNHPDYENIQYQKNLTTINIENIQAIHKPKNRDFEMFPIFAEGKDYNHWLTGII